MPVSRRGVNFTVVSDVSFVPARATHEPPLLCAPLFSDAQQPPVAAPEDFGEVKFFRHGGDDVEVTGQGGAEGVAVFIRPLREIIGEEHHFFIPQFAAAVPSPPPNGESSCRRRVGSIASRLVVASPVSMASPPAGSGSSTTR